MKALLKIKISLAIICLPFCLSGQDPISKTFYDTRIVNGQSTEMNYEGTLKFIIAHRFGRINSGAYELFGLDQSTIRLGLDYGIKNWLTFGIGRSTNEKTIDGFLKLSLLKQTHYNQGSPFTLVAYSNMAINGLKWQDTSRVNYFTSRLYYSYQLLMSRKFSDRLSFQIMPSMVHRNLIPNEREKHDVFAFGAAGRFQASKKFTFNFEYYFVLPNQLNEEFHNSLAFGIDMETKGHVFQFHFGNSRGMTEKFFITETSGEWFNGDIHFGFNITRDFKVKGKKH